MKKRMHDLKKRRSSHSSNLQNFLSNKYVIVAICALIFVLLMLAINIGIQFFSQLMTYLTTFSLQTIAPLSLSFPDPFSFDFDQNGWFYFAGALVSLAVCIRFGYKLKLNFSPLNHDQKGSRQWASIDELKAEYRKIPEKEKEYKGKPGFPISRYGDEIFIDDSPVNNLILGTSRSGKGELFVFPAIDIYSRAKQMIDRASMVIADPKGELAAASYTTLKQRGYNVQIFDIDTFMGMSYNPLDIIKNAYMENDLPAAQMLANTLSHILFHDPGAHEKVWQDWSIALTNALILAHVIDCCENAKLCDNEEDKKLWYDKINMYSVARLLIDLSTANEQSEKTELDIYFSNRPKDDLARIQYSSVSTAQGVTKGSIFASTLSVLTKFTAVNIAKMGCKNTVDMKAVGFDQEKPTAIFLVLPDNDTSCHFLATMFISQLYYILVKEGKKPQNNGKCTREVVFLLDEFGNIVPIPNMSHILNVCLSRNIRFSLIVQAYSQIYKLYGNEDAKSIIGACANQIYLLTIELETAKQFSELIGNETIVVRSRSGDPVSINKHLTEHVETKPLLNPNELMELMPGENVVCRVTKRQDLNGKKIIPNPIFNNDETIMKYRYEYLSDTFDNSNSFGDLNLEQTCKHKNVHLPEYVYTFHTQKESTHSKTPASASLSTELMEELIGIIQQHFEVSSTEILKMTMTDIDTYLNQLISIGLLSSGDYTYISDKIRNELGGEHL